MPEFEHLTIDELNELSTLLSRLACITDWMARRKHHQEVTGDLDAGGAFQQGIDYQVKRLPAWW